MTSSVSKKWIIQRCRCPRFQEQVYRSRRSSVPNRIVILPIVGIGIFAKRKLKKGDKVGKLCTLAIVKV
jgi:hypothetical protein